MEVANGTRRNISETPEPSISTLLYGKGLNHLGAQIGTSTRTKETQATETSSSEPPQTRYGKGYILEAYYIVPGQLLGAPRKDLSISKLSTQVTT